MKKASKKAKAREAEIQKKTRDYILEAAIGSLELSGVCDVDGPDFRDQFLDAVHEVIENEFQNVTRIAMGNPKLSQEQRSRASFRMSVAQLYFAALIKLIKSGNAQWDDGSLLPDQFKNMIRIAMERSKVVNLDEDARE